MGGRVTVLAVFAVSPTNYQRSTSRSPAEILACQLFGDVKNSETARCSAAVSRCFVNCKDGATGGSQSSPNPWWDPHVWTIS